MSTRFNRLSLRVPATLVLLLTFGVFPVLMSPAPASAHDHEKPKAPITKDHSKEDDHHAKAVAKTYSCPMHPQVKQKQPGECAICGMDLVADKAAMRFTTLLQPAQPVAGQPFWLSYRFATAAGDAPDLVEVHTKLSHLIVVSKDLSYFDHLHPEQVAPGKFMIQLTLPAGGDYVIYPDATARGGAPQVERFAFRVDGTKAAVVSLKPTDMSVMSGDYDIHLALDPQGLKVGEATFTFHITKHGQPATDLMPYLGAGGHLVIISQDTKEFLHAHPEDGEHEGMAMGGDHEGMKMGDEHAGMDMGGEHEGMDMDGKTDKPSMETVPGTVSFHTVIPAAGRYKAWGQFLTPSGVIIAPFVIDVR